MLYFSFMMAEEERDRVFGALYALFRPRKSPLRDLIEEHKFLAFNVCYFTFLVCGSVAFHKLSRVSFQNSIYISAMVGMAAALSFHFTPASRIYLSYMHGHSAQTVQRRKDFIKDLLLAVVPPVLTFLLGWYLGQHFKK